MMNRRQLIWLSFGLAVLLATNYAIAGCPSCGTPCAHAGGCGEVQYVEQTICEPQWVTETRKVTVCEYKQEQKQCTRTVYKCVPETKQVERKCTVMVPETRVRKVPYTVCKPVIKEVPRQYTVCVPEWKEVEKQYTVMVPQQETRKGVRRVCRMVEEQVTDTVCVDRGQWETRVVEVPCGSSCGRRRCRRVCCCDPCGQATKGAVQKGSVQKGGTQTVCQQVWVPNLVQEEVTRTVCKPQIIEEPCEYTVTVC